MPLSCALTALAAVLLLPHLLRRVTGTLKRAMFISGGLGLIFAAWHIAAANPAVQRWLLPLCSPIIGVYLVIILPALYIPPGSRWRKIYLVIPAAAVLMIMPAVLDAYGTVPETERGFYWFLIRPAWLIGGIAGLLVLIQPFLRMDNFRLAVRTACFIVLVYGGFMFRQDYGDYVEMQQLRRDKKDIMMVSETVPVMRYDWRMLHLPSAPCRFTADGGYVQGCNMELFQRILQLDAGALLRKDEGTISSMSVIAGAVVLFLIISFIAARWMCGWLCPLSAIGGIVDWVRKRFNLPHVKPAQPVKLAFLFSGIGLAGVALAMAKAIPHLDESGRFMGCKIPIYPFCKICPSQQICPVMAGGPAAYPGLPNWQWGGGFFVTCCVALLALFGISFAIGRRLWCRFCPMGMISGLFNRGAAFKLAKDAGKCNRCGVCADVCPMDIDFVRSEMEQSDVGSFDCVLCLRCVDKCPRDGCLSLEHAGVKVVESKWHARG